MGRCRRLFISTGGAWRWATTWSRLCCSIEAKPGDKVLIAVKLLATVDKKQFTRAAMKIDFAASRPNPEDVRTEFLSAALLVPSFQRIHAADQATLNKAIAAVDLKALDAGDQAAVRCFAEEGASRRWKR